MPEKPPGASLILQAVDRRGDTDERPSYFVHVALPIILAVVGIGAAIGIVVATAGFQGSLGSSFTAASATVVGAAVLLAVAALVAAAILAIVGIYKVMRRRDAHFARDEVLREGLIEWARWTARRNGGDRAHEHVEAMESIHADASIDETRKPAPLHLVLNVVVPFWYLYIVYYLLKDFAAHARRQARFFRELGNLAEEAGLEVATGEAVPSVNERSYLLSLLLILIVPFGSLAVLYWLYTDPEEHFDQQRRHEDAVVELVTEEGPARPSGPQAGEETDAPDEPEAGPTGGEGQEQSPIGASAEEDEPPASEEESEPEYTVWTCGECSSKFKVPPKRPVRVTCKNCENEEILEE